MQTSFAMYLLCKSVVIKPLWDVFNYNLACFKMKMDKWTRSGHLVVKFVDPGKWDT